MSHLESTLQAALLLRAPESLPDIRFFRRNIGRARGWSGQVIHFGIKGQCDLYGILKGGQLVEVELKADTGHLKEDQEAWRDWCLSWNVPWILLKAKKNETVEQTVARWLIELRAYIQTVESR